MDIFWVWERDWAGGGTDKGRGKRLDGVAGLQEREVQSSVGKELIQWMRAGKGAGWGVQRKDAERWRERSGFQRGA